MPLDESRVALDPEDLVNLLNRLPPDFVICNKTSICKFIICNNVIFSKLRIVCFFVPLLVSLLISFL